MKRLTLSILLLLLCAQINAQQTEDPESIYKKIVGFSHSGNWQDAFEYFTESARDEFAIELIEMGFDSNSKKIKLLLDEIDCSHRFDVPPFNRPIIIDEKKLEKRRIESFKQFFVGNYSSANERFLERLIVELSKECLFGSDLEAFTDANLDFEIGDYRAIGFAKPVRSHSNSKVRSFAPKKLRFVKNFDGRWQFDGFPSMMDAKSDW